MKKNNLLEEYYSQIRDNSFSAISYPDVVTKEQAFDEMNESDLLTKKQSSDVKRLYEFNNLIGNDPFSHDQNDFLNSGIHECYEILIKRKESTIADYYRRNILCKSLPTGEVNAIVTEAPNDAGYLVLIDSGLLMLCSDSAKIAYLLIQDLGLNFTQRRFVNEFSKQHFKSLEFYADNGIYQSFSNPLTNNDLIDIVSAGRIFLYILKFIVGHEISHVTEGHFSDAAKNMDSHAKEYQADIKSMVLNLDSFPSQEMLKWDEYKEAMIAPFILLGIFHEIEKIRGVNKKKYKGTHPVAQDRILNLKEFYMGNIETWQDVQIKVNKFYKKFGVHIKL